MSQKWTEHAAERIRQESEERRRREELELTRDKRIKAQSPYLWDDLVGVMKLRINDLNYMLRDRPKEQFKELCLQNTVCL
jgi:hypothetical protein